MSFRSMAMAVCWS